MKRDVHDLLCDAICNRQLVRFEYHGGVRTVEPHVYGLNSKGEEVLSAFQQYGFSRSHAPHHWKQFKINEMKSFEVLPKMFKGPRAGYSGDMSVKEVYCSIREEGPPLEQQSFEIEIEDSDLPRRTAPEPGRHRKRSSPSHRWQRIRTDFVKEDERD